MTLTFGFVDFTASHNDCRSRDPTQKPTDKALSNVSTGLSVEGCQGVVQDAECTLSARAPFARERVDVVNAVGGAGGGDIVAVDSCVAVVVAVVAETSAVAVVAAVGFGVPVKHG